MRVLHHQQNSMLVTTCLCISSRMWLDAALFLAFGYFHTKDIQPGLSVWSRIVELRTRIYIGLTASSGWLKLKIRCAKEFGKPHDHYSWSSCLETRDWQTLSYGEENLFHLQDSRRKKNLSSKMQQQLQNRSSTWVNKKANSQGDTLRSPCLAIVDFVSFHFFFSCSSG